MRDTVKLNKEGVCTVLISKEIFIDELRFDAKIMGLPDLPIVTIPDAITSDDWLGAAEKAVEEVIKKLTISH